MTPPPYFIRTLYDHVITPYILQALVGLAFGGMISAIFEIFPFLLFDDTAKPSLESFASHIAIRE